MAGRWPPGHPATLTFVDQPPPFPPSLYLAVYRLEMPTLACEGAAYVIHLGVAKLIHPGAANLIQVGAAKVIHPA